MTKVYVCTICHKILSDYKPHRLVHQEYGAGNYNQYGNKHNFDFCDDCFKIFKKWIAKHKEVK